MLLNISVNRRTRCLSDRFSIARPSVRPSVPSRLILQLNATAFASVALSLSNCESSVASAEERLGTSLCVNAAVGAADAYATRRDDSRGLIAPHREWHDTSGGLGPPDGRQRVTRRGLLPMHFK